MSLLCSRLSLAAAVFALALPSSSLAQGVAHRRAVFHNQKGGVTAVSGTAVKGPNGGEAVHGRAISTDGQGNVTTAHGGAFKGPNGARGARAASTTRNSDGSVTHKSGGAIEGPNGAKVAHENENMVNPDGSANHKGGFAASGANGSIKSTASAQRNADGSASSTRSTKVTGKSGNTLTEDKPWVKGHGVTRTATCTDAAGNVISCKR